MQNKEKKLVLTLILAIIGLLIVLLAGFLFLFSDLDGEKKKENKTSTSTSLSVIKEKEPSLDDEEEEEEEEEEENIPNYDHSLEIFSTPFGDGYEFPDLSDYDFVFLGDSIFDMFNSETSMPRQLEVYTKSRVYNLSKSMSCAGNSTNNKLSMYGLTSYFLQNSVSSDEVGSFNTDIKRFAEDKHNKKKMVIILNHCINDYTFSSPISNPNDSNDVNSYEGSLRTNIMFIKNAYPKAEVVFMEPYIFGINNCGTDPNTYGYTMDDYIAAAERVCNESGVKLFNLRAYAFFAEYREDYLLDDYLHPNDMCSKTIARLFCDFVANNLQ